eukprot:COSAG06_NODE_2866_length_6157_cov_2.940574_4_plen_139_part_00
MDTEPARRLVREHFCRRLVLELVGLDEPPPLPPPLLGHGRQRLIALRVVAHVRVRLVRRLPAHEPAGGGRVGAQGHLRRTSAAAAASVEKRHAQRRDGDERTHRGRDLRPLPAASARRRLRSSTATTHAASFRNHYLR